MQTARLGPVDSAAAPIGIHVGMHRHTQTDSQSVRLFLQPSTLGRKNRDCIHPI
jgi:hypothetical protein